MEYKIECTDANSLISTILGCFKKVKNGKKVKADPQGAEIKTWDITTTNQKEEVLIHTTDQWEEKGCLILKANEDNDCVIVKFFYWSNWVKDHEKTNEEAYYLGRFTELILVHFYFQIIKIEIQ